MITNILRSMKSSILRPMMSPSFAGDPLPPVTRVIVDRTIVQLSQSFLIDTPIIMGVNWQVTFEFYQRANQNKMVFQDPMNTNNFVKMIDDGTIEFSVKGDTNEVLTFGAGLIDRNLHTVTLGCNNGTMFASVDGGAVSQQPAPANAVQFEVDSFLQTAGLTYTNGLSISNMAFEDISGGVNYTFPINTLTGNVENTVEGNRVLTYSGFPDSQRYLFTLTGSKFVYQETITDPGMDNGNAWNYNASEWLFGASEVSCNGSQVAATSVTQLGANILYDFNVDWVIDVLSVSVGTVNIKSGGIILSGGILAAGVYSGTSVSGFPNEGGIQGETNFVGSIGTCSLTPIINIAF